MECSSFQRIYFGNDIVKPYWFFKHNIEQQQSSKWYRDNKVQYCKN